MPQGWQRGPTEWGRVSDLLPGLSPHTPELESAEGASGQPGPYVEHPPPHPVPSNTFGTVSGFLLGPRGSLSKDDPSHSHGYPIPCPLSLGFSLFSWLIDPLGRSPLLPEHGVIVDSG